MLKNQTPSRRLHYQITQEEYSALRSCLSARTEETSASIVHTMFFTSYRNYITPQTSEEPAEAEQLEGQFSLNYYDGDPTFLLLERRIAEQRTTAMVTEAECRALLAGETDWLLDRHDPLFGDFYDKLTERMLLPQAVVTYRREVYTAEGLDLSVTLDTDIRLSLEHMDFLDPGQLAQGTSEQDRRILMEVSYSDCIPDNVLSLLAENAPRRKLLRERSVRGRTFSL